MKAAVFYGGKDIRVEEVPTPAPGRGEALIRITAAGICGSDLHDYRQKSEKPWIPYPHTSGHELTGVVTGLGPGVTKVKLGQRVGVEPLHLIGCGKCRWCLQGHYHACASRGRNPDGSVRHSSGFAEYDVAPEDNLYVLPDSVSTEAAAILDVYACAVHSIHRIHAYPSYNVVVIGPGPIGISIAEAYRALGARQVIMVGTSDYSLQLAKSFACDQTINSAKVDPVTLVREMTSGEGADVVIEAVGGHSSTFASSIAMLANQGTLGIIGMYQELQSLDTALAMQKEIQISWINSYAAWNGVREFQITLDWIVSGRFQPDKIITHKVPLDKIGQGFAMVTNRKESHAVKVLVLP
jgi:2-desacetyl-2-hydroxyethyl bacteriochlorophyllide A dehydrogenase